MDGILRDATTLIVFLRHRILLHSIVLNTLQVEDQAVEYILELGSRQIHGLVIVEIGDCGIGNIAEGANQIEVHQVAKGRYFSLRGTQLTLGVVRVFLSHTRCKVEHGVTTVDNVVEVDPRSKAVAGVDVLLEDVIEIFLIFNICAAHDIVGTELAPSHHSVDDVLRLHGGIATCHHVLNVGFFVPELIEHDELKRFYLKEVGARRESASTQQSDEG